MGRSQAVRRLILDQEIVGSNPTAPAKRSTTEVDLPARPYFTTSVKCSYICY